MLSKEEIAKFYENKKNAKERSVPFMKFYSDAFFSGSSLIGEDVSQIFFKGNGDCSTLWARNDLGDLGWNDIISSWEIRRQVVMTHPNDEVRVKIYRSPGFPSNSCQQEGWIVDLDNFDAPNLTSARWCPFGAKLNDDINGWTVTICRNNCNDCYQNL